MTVDIGTTLSALADDTRRAVVEVLADGPVSAGQLAARLQVTPAALTRHLRVLRGAGLVAVSLDTADTRRHVYSMQPVPLRQLGAWAEQLTEFWATQLTSFADHVEARRDD